MGRAASSLTTSSIISLGPDASGRAEVLLDMGTELDAALRVLMDARRFAT
jgi:hypothetical protein